MSFKAVCLALVLTLASCASPKPAAKQPESAAAKAEPVKPVALATPSVVGGEKWSMDLQEPLLWERRLLPAKPSQNTMNIEGNWVTLKKFGSKPIVLTVMTTEADIGLQPEEFILGEFLFQDQQPDVQTFKVIKVRLDSGEVAGMGLQGRHTTYGDIGVMELITLKNAVGYLVTCSSAIEDAEQWQETCDEVLSSFVLK